MAKRLFDIVFSLLGLAVVGLPMLVIAAVIKLTDPGPVLYRQVRVGKNGREFRILKFRTMVVNAERIGAASMASGTGLRRCPSGLAGIRR